MAVVTFSRAFALFGALVAVSLALVAAAPGEFLEELNFLKSLKLDNLMANKNDQSIKISASPKLSTPQIIERYGYPSETHTVKTDDGYLLGVHRIPNPGKPVIFLQHGVLSSSADWVILGHNKALALMLHDAGYDVWMGNSRGNTYSRAHEKMSPSSGDFWDFSWHEIGYHDLPACIDYVLKKTGKEDLLYIGHSQGTTAFFVMMSERPEYNKKVRAMIAMAPIAYLNEIRSFPLRVISLATSQVAWITKMLGLHEFLPSNFFVRQVAGYLCAEDASTQSLCKNTLFLIAGFNTDQFNKTLLPEILENVPAGASTKQMLHFSQLIARDPIFRQYDYGWFKNMWRYGSWNPPSYDLSKITTPVHLHYGENDLLAVPEGVSLLHKTLPNSVEFSRVPHDYFNHLDFLFAKDARSLIYERVVSKVKELVPTIFPSSNSSLFNKIETPEKP